MNKLLNKSSTYVQSLVDFALDTKPYHSKITEIAVEYQFEDTINVKMEDSIFSRLMTKAAWGYNFFSDANPANRAFPLQRVVSPFIFSNYKNDDPLNSLGGFKVGRDENTDMALVPTVFNKRTSAGIFDANIQKSAGSTLSLIEGLDYFHNYGSNEFRVSTPSPTELDQNRRWQETRAESVVLTTTLALQSVALDVLNPNSINRQVRSLLGQIEVHLVSYPNAAASAELATLISAVDLPSMPTSYEALLNSLCTTFYFSQSIASTVWNITHNLGGAPDNVMIKNEFGAVITPAFISNTSANTTVVTFSAATSGDAILIKNITPALSGYSGWIGQDSYPTPTSKYVNEKLSQLSPSLYFNHFSDLRLRENGGAFYDGIVAAGFTISNVVAVFGTDSDEWTLKVIDTVPQVVSVTGKNYGLIGAFVVGSSFTSPYLTFDSSTSAGTLTLGDEYILTPDGKIVIDNTAPLEVWNIIKTNPQSYSRPSFVSTRFGYIQSATTVIGQVTIIDGTIPTGTIILTATSGTTFSLSSTIEPSYTGSVTVGVPFNDGRLQFTIMAGSAQPFAAGDQFLINIINEPPQHFDLGLYYGYDLDSYDNQTVVYENQNSSDPLYNVPLDFRYDSRFFDFDINSLGLALTQAVVDGRQFKLTAAPDGAPIAVLQKDGSGPTNVIDLAGPTSGIAPDPSLTSVPVVSMPGDPNPSPDLQVFYAQTFGLQYSDDGGTTWSSAISVPVNVPYSNASLGISLTIPFTSKPFIAVTSDTGISGGDVFFFRVTNPGPIQDPIPAIFSSPNVPRIAMYGEGFFNSPAADWTITFNSSDQYTLTGIYTTGTLAGSTVTGYPVTGNLSVPGAWVNRNLTYKDDYLYFTIIPSILGFASGDEFYFSTYDEKPAVLVHGSVSGWQPMAEYGKWYWNGKIGFKIDETLAIVFKNNQPIASSDGDYTRISVSQVRPDTPSLVYTFNRVVDGSTITFMVNRSDVGIVDFCPSTGVFIDKYIKVILSDPSTTFQVCTYPDELDFWNAQDTVIFKSDVGALQPKTDDFVNVKKAEVGRLAINLDYSILPTPPTLLPLSPFSIDPDFIDLSTGTYFGAPPVETYSPEAILLNNWLPLKVDGYDAVSSFAHLPDTATEMRVKSASSGESVGTIYTLGTLNEPIRFQWDEAFFNKYLPLNSQANVITYGSHLNENVRVLISEKVNFLTSGGALFENALFSDVMTISAIDNHTINIDLNQFENVNANVADGPFDGFLPGYSNLPYDAEDALGIDFISLAAASGQYDTGTPLVDNFLRAVYLNSLPILTAEQLAELTSISYLIDDYLQPGGIGATSLMQFLTALDADAYAAGGVEPTLGIPKRGMAADINKTDSSTATSNISEAFSAVANVLPLSYDESGYGSGGFDADGDVIVYFTAGASMNPANNYTFPYPVPPSASYSTLDTPFTTSIAARVFEITFPAPPINYAAPTIPVFPVFRILTPTITTPLTISYVEQINARKFRFSMASTEEAKVITT